MRLGSAHVHAAIRYAACFQCDENEMIDLDVITKEMKEQRQGLFQDTGTESGRLWSARGATNAQSAGCEAFAAKCLDHVMPFSTVGEKRKRESDNTHRLGDRFIGGHYLQRVIDVAKVCTLIGFCNIRWMDRLCDKLVKKLRNLCNGLSAWEAAARLQFEWNGRRASCAWTQSADHEG